jgi:hypothetical protein
VTIVLALSIIALFVSILLNIRAIFLLKRTRKCINGIIAVQIEMATLIPKTIASSLSILLSEDEDAKSALKEMISK